MLLLGWILCTAIALWTLPAITALWRNQLTPAKLNPVVPDPHSQSKISVSVIVPARNEEGQIEKALRTILRSQHIQLQVIAVNDRSTDSTGELMEKVARDDSRLSVIHIEEDPVG